MADWIVEPERRTAVAGEFDVVVAGGGTAGPVAAIAAARAGATVALVERFGVLGGCGTVGRCSHLGNRYVDERGTTVVEGIPLEVLRRVVEAGGAPFDELERTLHGKTGSPAFIQVDPEILAIVLMEMVDEAGVRLFLHTTVNDPWVENGGVGGIVVQIKSGRFALRGRVVVDATGEADVAKAAGASSGDNPSDPSFATSYGLLMRIGNVDQEKLMRFILELPAGEPDDDYADWLSRATGLSREQLSKDGYWRHFLEPQPTGLGVPRTHPGKASFGPQAKEWFQSLWESDGLFNYLGMHYFRHPLRRAVEAGDMTLIEDVPGFGRVGFNFDGVTGGTWRPGEVLVNAVKPQDGFDAFDADHITRVELAARRRALTLLRFFIGYVPGFEEAYGGLRDHGTRLRPRVRAEDVRGDGLAEETGPRSRRPAVAGTSDEAVHPAPAG